MFWQAMISTGNGPWSVWLSWRIKKKEELVMDEPWIFLFFKIYFYC